MRTLSNACACVPEMWEWLLVSLAGTGCWLGFLACLCGQQPHVHFGASAKMAAAAVDAEGEAAAAPPAATLFDDFAKRNPSVAHAIALDELRFACPHCRKPFRYHASMTRHIATKHPTTASATSR